MILVMWITYIKESGLLLMIDLPNITLLTIDGIGNDVNAIKALKYSTKNINFGDIKYITAGDLIPTFCKTIKISKLNYQEYNAFCLSELKKYVDTDYVLLVQSDGFVINPNKWSNEYLKYDYIGAAWDTTRLITNTIRAPLISNKLKESQYSYNVGNGGFSLRSKKLLEQTSLQYKEEYKNHQEDAIIGIVLRKNLETSGLVFPENNICFNFSCEMKTVNGNNLSSDNSFGFHCDESHPDKVKLLDTIEEKEILCT